MSEQINQIRGPLSRLERKQLLVLACAADRAAWNHSCRASPSRNPASKLAMKIMGFIEPLSHLLPRRIGGWIRGATFVGNLCRQFGWLGR